MTKLDTQSQTTPTDYFGLEIPLMDHLGLIPEAWTPELTRTRLPYRPELLNSRGDVHGGALMAALDFTFKRSSTR